MLHLCCRPAPMRTSLCVCSRLCACDHFLRRRAHPWIFTLYCFLSLFFIKLGFCSLYFSVCSSCVRLSACVFVHLPLGYDCCYLETAAWSSLVNRWQRRDRQLGDVEGAAIMSNPLMLQFFGVFERMASGEGHWRCGPTQRHLWLLQVSDGLNAWKEEIKSIRVKKKGEWQAEHIFQEGWERETKTWWIDGLRRIDQ